MLETRLTLWGNTIWSRPVIHFHSLCTISYKIYLTETRIEIFIRPVAAMVDGDVKSGLLVIYKELMLHLQEYHS